MSDEWGTGQLDAAAYLSRIRHAGPPGTSAATLAALHRAHATSIPYENTDVLLGREIVLDVAALQDKLVRRPRGGYCYENNLLFAAALTRLGFPVTRCAARVRIGGTGKLRPRTHVVLLAEAEGRRWVCDLGFGAKGPLEPVPLTDGVEVTQDGWRFGLRNEDGTWVMRSWHAGRWHDLYAFTAEPQHFIDYVVANHFAATHSRSPFTSRLIVQRQSPGRRMALVDDQLSCVTPDGESTRTVGPEELDAVLTGEFGISLSAAELGALAGRHYGASLAPDERAKLAQFRTFSSIISP